MCEKKKQQKTADGILISFLFFHHKIGSDLLRNLSFGDNLHERSEPILGDK